MTLNKLKKEHIVAIAAHPDDEGSAWATLSKYSRFGAKVSIIWMTLGDRFIAPIKQYSHLLSIFIKSFFSKKSRHRLSKIISNIRRQEALKAARLINATPYFLHFKDSCIPNFNDKTALIRIIDLLRSIRPTIILTHWFRAPHSDHRATSYLITRSFLLANDPKFKTANPPSSIRLLLFWLEHTPFFHPNFFINATNFIHYFKNWNKLYSSQSTKLVGRFIKFKYRLFAKKTPYDFVEPFIVYNKKLSQYFGDYFPY
ncbi:MAG: PIG-L deacetylase family protein [Candidatus Helarchaeota archaeon]